MSELEEIQTAIESKRQGVKAEVKADLTEILDCIDRINDKTYKLSGIVTCLKHIGFEEACMVSFTWRHLKDAGLLELMQVNQKP